MSHQNPSDAPMPDSLVRLLATATGLCVAGIYYAQPLLEAMRQDLGLGVGAAAMVVTVSQVGYGLGLALLVPLGDMLERRRLVVWLMACIALALVGLALSRGWTLLLAASALVGFLSVTAQALVALAATLAAPPQRGQVVGRVMSGLLIGVLLARTAAGWIGQLLGWRAVFWLAAGLVAGCAWLLRRRLPESRPEGHGAGYLALVASTVSIVREEPVLRLRSLYGAMGFAAFSAFWTPLAFMLSGPPHELKPGAVGLFGLAGLAGALAAVTAGRLADRGHVRAVTGCTALLLMASWLPVWLGQGSLVWLTVGVALLDLAAQGLHISNQSEIYRTRPEARSRITSAYMTFFFIGGVLGSSLSALVYPQAGWTGVCQLGAGFGAVAVLAWLITLLKGNGRSARK